MEELHELFVAGSSIALDGEEERLRELAAMEHESFQQLVTVEWDALQVILTTAIEESELRSTLVGECAESWAVCETSEREELEGFLLKKHRRLLDDATKEWNNLQKPAAQQHVEPADQVEVVVAPSLNVDDVAEPESQPEHAASGASSSPTQQSTTSPSKDPAPSPATQQQPQPQPAEQTTSATSSRQQSPDALAASRRSRNRSSTTVSVRVNEVELRRRHAEQEQQMKREADEARAFAARGSWMYKPGSQSQTKSVFRFGGSTWNKRYVWVVGERLL